MKKSVIIVCLLVPLLLLSSVVPAGSASAAGVTASAAIVMDYDTGEVLWAKDPDTMRVPASMTKIMTAYIIYQELEAGNITKDTEFTISDNARAISRDSNYPTAVPLVGATVDVDKLLELIMIPSASASCIVAAENISGSEAAFVERMNDTAKELGMQAAYENCHGAKPHYITARSIAILIRTFIQEYPDILNYTSMRYMTYNGSTYSNTNKLLSTYYYEGADGFKTGTIAEAGYCLSATALRDGRRIITVVMNSSSTAARHTDSQWLLDFGFNESARRDISRETAQVTFSTQQPLKIGGDMTLAATFTDLYTPFGSPITLRLGEEVIETYDWVEVQNGTQLKVVVNLDESYVGQTSVEVSLEYPLADGTTHSITGELAISEDEPLAFRDIAYHWAEDDIEAFAAAGYIQGYPDETFRPEREISRAEFASIIVNALGNQLRRVPGLRVEFTDIEGHWAEEAIQTLANAGIVEGFGGAFRPDDPITRQEAARIAASVLKLQGDGEVDFVDSADIADWALEPISAAVAAGLFEGYPDESFRPDNPITRAESVVVIQRMAAA